MALNIKDPETDRLARELADRMGTTITEALKVALQDRLLRTRPRADVAFAEIQAIIDRGRARPILDNRTVTRSSGTTKTAFPRDSGRHLRPRGDHPGRA